ncbi:hypothetical protein OG21DRAFT_1338548 [Imleria badia]|nr:hypothetical protein OG21DRAFT_1338548 [Imleria badia]
MESVPWLIGFQNETRCKIKSRPLLMNVLLTNTHVFAFFWTITALGKWDKTVVQAFTVPDNLPSTENRNRVLHLSHEGILFQRDPSTIIRDSVVDPITGSIKVRFLCDWMDRIGSCLHPKCIEVTLPKPSPIDVTPMLISWHSVLGEKGPLHQDRPFERDSLRSTDDGYTRGLFRILNHYPNDDDMHIHPWNLSAVVKFTIDATQECCVATLSQFFPLPAEWKHFNCCTQLDSWMNFDAIWGRLFYIRRVDETNQVLVVMDIE